MTDFTPPRRLTAEDDADGFDCGLPVVNDWLRNQLRNAGKQHTAVAYATFCDGAPAGFYTLGAYSIGHAEANGWLRRNSPDPIPAILLGMLGVAMRYQTMHVGAQLLRDAAMRAMGAAEIVGAKALLVEPASDRATRFYEHYGFRHIERSGRMFIPLRQWLQRLIPCSHLLHKIMVGSRRRVYHFTLQVIEPIPVILQIADDKAVQQTHHALDQKIHRCVI